MKRNNYKLIILLCFVFPFKVHASELYSSYCDDYNTCPQISFYQPEPVVTTSYQPTIVHVQSTQPPVTIVEEEVTTVKTTTTQKKDRKVDTELDAGVGMWIVPKLKETVNLSYNARLSLLVKDVIMTLSFNHIPDIEWEESLAQTSCEAKGNLYLIGMGFGYRWNKLGHLHPEFGAKFDALILDRNNAERAMAFGIGGTIGLMADFPLPYGSLMGGIQGEGHYHVWHQENFFPPRTTGAIIALLGYKF